MIFSKEKITTAYTLEKCPKCSMEKKRRFREGDVLFCKTVKCESCNEVMAIEKIFGETVK